MAILKSKSGASYDTKSGKKTSSSGAVSYQTPNTATTTAKRSSTSSRGVAVKDNALIFDTPEYNKQFGGLSGTALTKAVSDYTKKNPNSVKSAQDFTTEIGKPMDLSSLQQPTVNYETIPPPKDDAFSGLFDGAIASTKYEAPKADTAKTDAQRILETMAADKPESQADLLNQMKKEAGIQQMEARANDLKSQIEMEQARTQSNLLKLRGVGGTEGVTEAVYGGQQAQIDRESAIRLLPLTAQYNAEVGRLESAEKNIRELFGAIVADQQNQRSYRQNLYSMAYTMARDDQKDLLDKSKEETRKQERQQDIFLDMKKQASDMAMKAGDYKLAGEILTAKDGATVTAKMSAITSSGSKLEAPTVKTINGVDMQWNPTTGKWDEIGSGGGTNTLSVAQAKNNIDLISGLVSDSYLKTAVGTNAFARASFSNLFTGGKGDFISGVKQLTSQLSLDSLIRAKSQGATFGALSDSELAILSSSASKIGTWEVKDSNGKVVGYKTSEKSFKKELDKINNLGKLDYLIKGGNLDDIGATQLADGTIWVKNSDGTLTQLQ